MSELPKLWVTPDVGMVPPVVLRTLSILCQAIIDRTPRSRRPIQFDFYSRNRAQFAGGLLWIESDRGQNWVLSAQKELYSATRSDVDTNEYPYLSITFYAHRTSVHADPKMPGMRTAYADNASEEVVERLAASFLNPAGPVHHVGDRAVQLAVALLRQYLLSRHFNVAVTPA